jgi:hypothetical protein
MPLVLASAPASGQATATLTILHGLPGFTADVYLNGSLALDGFKPESSTPPLDLASGTYRVAIRNVGTLASSKPALSATLTLAAGHNYTAIAHLTPAGGSTLSLFDNDISTVPVGMTRVVVRNTSDVPELDLRLDGLDQFQALLVDRSDRAIVRHGKHSIDAVAAVGSTQLIASTPLTLSEGHVVFVYVVGSEKDKSLDFMIQDITDAFTAPTNVPSGNGGIRAYAPMPPWASWLTAFGALLAVYAGGALIRRKRVAL